jgi:hypothetical protein
MSHYTSTGTPADHPGTEHAAADPATPAQRTCDIPGLPAHLQPAPEIKAAYWLAATLTDDYGWQLFEIGNDIAAGGFIASTPEDAMAVYPASMAGDGTPASALARLLGGMSTRDTAIVATLIEWHAVPGLSSLR